MRKIMRRARVSFHIFWVITRYMNIFVKNEGLVVVVSP